MNETFCLLTVLMAFNGARLYPVKYVMQDVRLGFSWELANTGKLSVFTGMVHWVRELAQFDLPARVVDSRGAVVVSGRAPGGAGSSCLRCSPATALNPPSLLPLPCDVASRELEGKGAWSGAWNHGVQWGKGQGSVGVEWGPRWHDCCADQFLMP